MSISLLKDNTLWADSVGQDQTSYPYLYTEMKKLFISDRNDVAITVIGDAAKEADKETIISQALTLIHSDVSSPSKTKLIQDSVLFRNRSIVVMTSTTTTLISDLNVYNIQGDTAAWGDNRMAVLTALHLGKSPKKAIKLAIEMYYGAVPNYPIHSIKQSKLKPIDLGYYILDGEEK